MFIDEQGRAVSSTSSGGMMSALGNSMLLPEAEKTGEIGPRKDPALIEFAQNLAGGTISTVHGITSSLSKMGLAPEEIAKSIERFQSTRRHWAPPRDMGFDMPSVMAGVGQLVPIVAELAAGGKGMGLLGRGLSMGPKALGLMHAMGSTGTMFLQTFGDDVDRAKANGMSEDEATLAGFLNSSVKAALWQALPGIPRTLMENTAARGVLNLLSNSGKDARGLLALSAKSGLRRWGEASLGMNFAMLATGMTDDMTDFLASRGENPVEFAPHLQAAMENLIPTLLLTGYTELGRARTEFKIRRWFSELDTAQESTLRKRLGSDVYDIAQQHFMEALPKIYEAGGYDADVARKIALLQWNGARKWSLEHGADPVEYINKMKFVWPDKGIDYPTMLREYEAAKSPDAKRDVLRRYIPKLEEQEMSVSDASDIEQGRQEIDILKVELEDKTLAERKPVVEMDAKALAAERAATVAEAMRLRAAKVQREVERSRAREGNKGAALVEAQAAFNEVVLQGRKNPGQLEAALEKLLIESGEMSPDEAKRRVAARPDVSTAKGRPTPLEAEYLKALLRHGGPDAVERYAKLAKKWKIGAEAARPGGETVTAPPGQTPARPADETLPRSPATDPLVYAVYLPQWKLAMFFKDSTPEDIIHEWFHHVFGERLLPQRMYSAIIAAYAPKGKESQDWTAQERQDMEERAARAYMAAIKNEPLSEFYKPELADAFKYIKAVMAKGFHAAGEVGSQAWEAIRMSAPDQAKAREFLDVTAEPSEQEGELAVRVRGKIIGRLAERTEPQKGWFFAESYDPKETVRPEDFKYVGKTREEALAAPPVSKVVEQLFPSAKGKAPALEAGDAVKGLTADLTYRLAEGLTPPRATPEQTALAQASAQLLAEMARQYSLDTRPLAHERLSAFWNEILIAAGPRARNAAVRLWAEMESTGARFAEARKFFESEEGAKYSRKDDAFNPEARSFLSALFEGVTPDEEQVQYGDALHQSMLSGNIGDQGIRFSKTPLTDKEVHDRAHIFPGPTGKAHDFAHKTGVELFGKGFSMKTATREQKMTIGDIAVKQRRQMKQTAGEPSRLDEDMQTEVAQRAGYAKYADIPLPRRMALEASLRFAEKRAVQDAVREFLGGERQERRESIVKDLADELTQSLKDRPRNPSLRTVAAGGREPFLALESIRDRVEAMASTGWKALGKWRRAQTNDIYAYLLSLDDGNKQGAFQSVIGSMFERAANRKGQRREMSGKWLADYMTKNQLEQHKVNLSQPLRLGKEHVRLTVDQALWAYAFTGGGRHRNEIASIAESQVSWGSDPASRESTVRDAIKFVETNPHIRKFAEMAWKYAEWIYNNGLNDTYKSLHDGKPLGNVPYYMLGVREDGWSMSKTDPMMAIFDITKTASGKRGATETMLQERKGGRASEYNSSFFNALSHYMDQADTYIAKAEIINDLSAIMDRTDVQDALSYQFGTEAPLRTLRQFVEREQYTTGRTEPLTDNELGARKLRLAGTTAMLWGKPFSWAIQGVTAVNAMSEIPKGHTLSYIKNLWDAIAYGNRNIKTIKDAILQGKNPWEGHPGFERMRKIAPEILERYHRQGLADLEATIIDRGIIGKSKFTRQVIDAGMAPFRNVDMAIVIAQWNTTYDAMIEHLRDSNLSNPEIQDQARRFATRAVGKIQTPSNVEERSLWQTGREWQRALTMFASQPMKIFQYIGTDIATPLARGWREGGAQGWMDAFFKGDGFNRPVYQKAFYTLILPAVALGMMARRRPPESEEEVYTDLLTYSLTTVPIIGPMLSTTLFYDWKDSPTSLIYVDWANKASKGIADLYRGEFQPTTMKNLVQAGTRVTGVPDTLVNVAMEFIEDKWKDRGFSIRRALRAEPMPTAEERAAQRGFASR